MITVNGATFNEIKIDHTQVIDGRTRRDAILIVLIGASFDDVSEAFVDNATITYSANNQTVDLSYYSIRNTLSLNKDDSISVVMTKKTDIELYTEKIEQLEDENAELLFENLTGEDF